MSGNMIYQLKITLDEIQPPIWRRIQVPGNVSLLQLHFIFQIAMGWTNSHLHEFQISGEPYGTPDEDGGREEEIKEEKEYQLEQVVPDRGARFSYLYDFGDSWKHTIEVEEILNPSKIRHYPACLGGERACPPEDVGSTRGYEEFLEAISSPEHPEHEDYLVWAGGAFDPEGFDHEKTDLELNNYEYSEMMRVFQRHYSGEVGPELKLYQGISRWLEGLSPKQRSQLDELPLRRDTVSMLTYLRDHSVKGTQSTGNLPLKAIREIARDLVHPPILDRKIGERVYKLRTEFDVWPIYFIHMLLEVGGLLDGVPGRKLRLTPKGKQFLNQEPPIQVLFLLETWWHFTNWLIAYPMRGLEEQLPYYFADITFGLLLSLPTGRQVPYQDFADRLIKKGGLNWGAQDMTSARNLLHTSIERVVINILKDFQAVEKHEKDTRSGRYRHKKLYAFTITNLGRSLLKVLGGLPI